MIYTAPISLKKNQGLCHQAV